MTEWASVESAHLVKMYASVCHRWTVVARLTYTNVFCGDG